MKRLILCILIGTTGFTLSACKEDLTPFNKVPDFVMGEIEQTGYDGITDDLLTAGLGASGLAGAAPSFDDPVNPTSAELRRLAIYNNYRALVDIRVPGPVRTTWKPILPRDWMEH
ncbi:D-(-)-3-hydroxybutyrate oligomer hydrolase [Marinobacter salinus]|uniref:D-(-)-3-hydroxybutyrate oligomer hydrolase n=1 Tax=Marinobacter salinus TaxID=1874317 RepID=UPI000AF215E7|nr:D-(-)-3-hydroxybutyrate oligomer hydrolase [Marinobacter salinus]